MILCFSRYLCPFFTFYISNFFLQRILYFKLESSYINGLKWLKKLFAGNVLIVAWVSTCPTSYDRTRKQLKINLCIFCQNLDWVGLNCEQLILVFLLFALFFLQKRVKSLKENTKEKLRTLTFKHVSSKNTIKNKSLKLTGDFKTRRFQEIIVRLKFASQSIFVLHSR